ncbi:IclR family transcriptional regulator [Rhodococcus gannanensis]|uniref:IclR family transcriptional regulator n=1 Tax=Rhodococcus gannanensis TaxID=1960308 RepID=A0ABW4P0S3_9NOCA
MPQHPAGGDTTGSLPRAALILGAFTGDRRLNLTQIVAATGLPRSSVHRALEQLVALRWVHREGMDYQLGMRMIEFGAVAAQQNTLRRAALPSLHWLHRQTGCVVHLGVLDGPEVVYLEKVGGELLPTVRSHVGGRLPARSSTIGTALLAVAEDTPDLDRVRERRVSYGREKCIPGFSCVAVPIGPVDRTESAAAISVFGPAATIDDTQVVLSAQTAAARIWRRISGAESRHTA